MDFLRIDGDGTGFNGIDGGGTEEINFGFVSICLFSVLCWYQSINWPIRVEYFEPIRRFSELSKPTLECLLSRYPKTNPWNLFVFPVHLLLLVVSMEHFHWLMNHEFYDLWLDSREFKQSSLIGHLISQLIHVPCFWSNCAEYFSPTPFIILIH